jgi:predicted ATPase with chaperone activity
MNSSAAAGTATVNTNVKKHILDKPISVAQTGLSNDFLKNLLAKHIHQSGTGSVAELGRKLKLPGAVVQPILVEMKTEAQVETRPILNRTGDLIYGLTDRGRLLANNALALSGYVGPAPVPLREYKQLVKSQSVHKATISRDKMLETFKNVLISERVLDQLGPAMHSGKAIFIYGAPGTGKTYISHRLAKLLDEPVYIPYAISVGDSVIRIFDPQAHIAHEKQTDKVSLKYSEGYDDRYLLCERPIITAGSELTMEHIEVVYDADAKQYHAPLQLKANNGLFLLDDLGRQHIPTVDLLNRWIVPMEEKVDYHHLRSGSHFSVPFDIILLFSTNFDPKDLADDAFLRRIGHKIRFEALDRHEYLSIWKEECQNREIAFDPALLDYVITELHDKFEVDMLPCHPRDLLGLALDYAKYRDTNDGLNKELIDKAWDNYFIKEEGLA